MYLERNRSEGLGSRSGNDLCDALSTCWVINLLRTLADTVAQGLTGIHDCIDDKRNSVPAHGEERTVVPFEFQELPQASVSSR
jgi:hypothetical protein